MIQLFHVTFGRCCILDRCLHGLREWTERLGTDLKKTIGVLLRSTCYHLPSLYIKGTRLCFNYGNFFFGWLWEPAVVPRHTASSCWRPGPCLPPQTYHRDCDGISDVCSRRSTFTAPVLRGDWSVPLCSLGLPVFRADVCGDGAGVGPHSEREGKAETDQPGGLSRRWKRLDDVKDKMLLNALYSALTHPVQSSWCGSCW